jgi:hypothetical protein
VPSKGLVLLTSVGAKKIAGAKENPLSHIFILLCSYQLYKGLYKHLVYLCVGNTKTTERGGGGESVVYMLKQFYTF